MTARVLVVDDVLPNVKLLEAKLASEYYDVLTASDGPQALERIKQETPDIVLLDVMMPGMDGFEVCRRIKADPDVAHIPVVMITALSEPSDRVTGLEAGADDFLTKPVNDVALFARVRSLVRLKLMMDELRLREQTGNQFGVVESTTEATVEVGPDARVLVIEDNAADAQHIRTTLDGHYQVAHEADCEEALVKARGGDYDLIIVTLNHDGYDSLRLSSQLRTMEETRQVPILTVAEEGDDKRLVKALDIGVNDYLIRPIDRNELVARVLTQIRRKRYQDRLRQNYHLSLAMAVTDSLTGLYNRRYMTSHLQNLMEHSGDGAKPVSAMMMDIDYFKSFNDTHGHAVGDEVLKEFSARIQRSVRGVDLVSRIGGEEFVVIMPDTDLGIASVVAERLRKSFADEPFQVTADVGSVTVTCSIGVAMSHAGDDPDSLLKRADDALYRAKNDGRNRVVTLPESAPATQEQKRAAIL
ncbi:MAG: PleD family two-component system response regulator [Minwuiales bacterium]|nr:PleD family two-component system response regulator [Minwuiales bacterium]